MLTRETTFVGADGLQLLERCWRPDPPAAPSAILAIVHGLGEHGGRYAPLAEFLVPRGYAVHALDLRGHGRSPGKRGHIDAWRQFREDVAAFLAHVRAEDPEGRLFLYGYSLGGAIVLEFGLHGPEGLAGVIVSAPALDPSGVRDPGLEALSRVLSRLWPSFSLRVSLEPAALSRSGETSGAPAHDSLMHGRLSARALTETARALQWTRARAGAWRLPLLVVHGDADRIVTPDGSRAFVAHAHAGGAPDVELRLYKGGCHELHNDLEAPEVLADMAAWMGRH